MGNGRVTLVTAMVAALAGCGSSSPTSSGSESSASRSAEARRGETIEAPWVNRNEPAEASTSKSCAGQLRAGAHTACSFAEKVHAAFVEQEKSHGFPPAQVAARGSLKNRESRLQCAQIAERTLVECAVGNELVYFPLPSKERFDQQSPPGTSNTAEGGHPEGEDRLGSRSHAADTTFCEEHRCIAYFTSQNGTVIKCADGSYSHDGGIRGACSDDGGDATDESERE
jgi:hypothetical protein